MTPLPRHVFPSVDKSNHNNNLKTTKQNDHTLRFRSLQY